METQNTEEPAPVPPPPRQKERHPRYRASSIDKCSQDTLSRDPFPSRWFGREPATRLVALPPRSRLPTLLRPLPLSRWRARPRAAPGLFTHGRRGPRAACRLLQPIRPASTTAQSSKPRPPRPWSPTRAAFFISRTQVRQILGLATESSAYVVREQSAGGRASRHSQPRFHGPEA